jgi:hypothetical protein
MGGSGGRGSGRASGDRGAVIVEAAIALPLFVALIFGIIEFGLLFHDYLTVANITRTGARTGSAAGNDLLADYDILQSVSGATAAMPRGNIQYIVVYDALTPDGPVSSSCANGLSVPGICNVYVPSDLDRPETDFGCKNVGVLDSNWCPGTRRIASSALNGGPPNYLGVWVKVNHPMLTAMFGGQKTLLDSTVIRIEPRRG